jgi:hypothetical protein
MENNMKEIKTDRYLRKEAIYSDLPGDRSLPPGVDQRMIDERFEGTDPSGGKKQGEIEIPVNWTNTNRDMARLGYDTTGVPTEGNGNIHLDYLYNYEKDIDGTLIIGDIKIREKGPSDSQFGSFFEDEIKKHEKEIMREL